MTKLPNKLPKPGPYWKPPLAAQKGDLDGALLYGSVGLALTNWGSVDEIFARLFARFLDARAFGAGRVFGTTQGLTGKIDILAVATSGAFNRNYVTEEDRAHWDELVGHYRQATPRRNDIAHGIVRDFTVENEHVGAFLVPLLYAKGTSVWMTPAALAARTGLDLYGHFRYTSGDIHHFGARFLELEEWARDFFQMYSEKYPRK